MYPLETVNTDLCTHVIYGIGVIDKDSLELKIHDLWGTDFNNYFDQTIAAYKKRGIKVSIAVGGWTTAERTQFQRVAAFESSRNRFVERTVAFLRRHNFDGLDLNWLYPVCRGDTCDQDPREKEQFQQLVDKLVQAFKPRSLLLSAVVGKSDEVINNSYDVAHLSTVLDWITVRTINYHGSWLNTTGKLS